jgi:hypothetical protein
VWAEGGGRRERGQWEGGRGPKLKDAYCPLQWLYLYKVPTRVAGVRKGGAMGRGGGGAQVAIGAISSWELCINLVRDLFYITKRKIQKM